jgi:hypothetical protein
MTIITENHENNYLNHVKFPNLSSRQGGRVETKCDFNFPSRSTWLLNNGIHTWINLQLLIGININRTDENALNVHQVDFRFTNLDYDSSGRNSQRG